MNLFDEILFAIAAVFLACAACAVEPPAVLLARDGNRLVMFAEPMTDEVSWGSLPRVLPFEREHGISRVRIVRTAGGLTINAALDLPGPGWIYVDIIADDCGYCVTSRDNESHYETFEQADTIEDLSVDSRVLFLGVMNHLDQRLPDLATLRAVVHVGTPSESAPSQLAGMLARLDSDDYRERETASRELSRNPLLLRWLMERTPEDVSPEVECRINAAVAAYADAGRWAKLFECE